MWAKQANQSRLHDSRQNDRLDLSFDDLCMVLCALLGDRVRIGRLQLNIWNRNPCLFRHPKGHVCSVTYLLGS